MSFQSWGQTLISSQVDGAALGTSTTATSLLHTSAKYTLPPNFFSVGTALRLTATGRISNIVTTPGTFTLSVRMNSTPIIVFTGGAMPLNVAAKTNVTWWAEILLTCRAAGTGTAANLMGVGEFVSESVLGAAAGAAAPCLMPASAPAVGTGFDSTVANLVDLFGTWSISNAGNTVQLHQYSLEAMN